MKLDPLDRTAIARHQSPDGELVWRVERSDDAAGGAVFSAGFEGGFWHVHPDQLERTGEPLAVLLKVTDRVVISYVTAKRLALSLQQLVKRFEQQFGEIPVMPGQRK